MSAPRTATAGVDAPHAAYVNNGAITLDPTLLSDYDADEPDVGTRLVVMDRDGWATLHIVEARGGGKIEFGQRIPWPDGSIAARRIASSSSPARRTTDA
jgi:hypothetical protein